MSRVHLLFAHFAGHLAVTQHVLGVGATVLGAGPHLAQNVRVSTTVAVVTRLLAMYEVIGGVSVTVESLGPGGAVDVVIPTLLFSSRSSVVSFPVVASTSVGTDVTRLGTVSDHPAGVGVAVVVFGPDVTLRVRPVLVLAVSCIRCCGRPTSYWLPRRMSSASVCDRFRRGVRCRVISAVFTSSAIVTGLGTHLTHPLRRLDTLVLLCPDLTLCVLVQVLTRTIFTLIAGLAAVVVHPVGVVLALTMSSPPSTVCVLVYACYILLVYPAISDVSLIDRLLAEPARLAAVFDHVVPVQCTFAVPGPRRALVWLLVFVFTFLIICIPRTEFTCKPAVLLHPASVGETVSPGLPAATSVFVHIATL